MSEINLPFQIEIRGAKVHNLKNIDVNIPLHKFVAISGLSGSGKSSLAMNILYEEGSRRYLEALSTYTRRRIKAGSVADVDSIKHVPSALALKQRPAIPNERATVGTMSEVFNVVRLIFSRLGQPLCPNGHRLKPSLEIAQAMSKSGEEMGKITCPVCHAQFYAFSSEDFAFNSDGACETCQGTGMVKKIDESKLIADENLTLDEGAVASWHLPGRNFMPNVAEAAGVRIDVPYKDLTDKEKDFVLNGPKKKYTVDFKSGTGRVFHDFHALYENAHDAVYESQKTSKSARSQARINEFFTFSTCPTCHGSRLKPELLTQLAGDLNIWQVEQLTLDELVEWKEAINQNLPSDMEEMAKGLWHEFDDNLNPLLELGLGYLSLDRKGNSLSTGELQRIQLARTLRSETTGVLYVLDEPSIGLHPDNIKGLLHVFRQLIAQGNSLVVVDHNVDVIKASDWIIELGPGSGEQGGQIIAEGTIDEIKKNPASLIAPYLNGKANLFVEKVERKPTKNFEFEVQNYFNIKDIDVSLPINRITSVTGFSGAGKTSLILDSLAKGIQHPEEVSQLVKLKAPFKNVVTVNAAPIGKSTRSTVATYTSIMDNLRKLFAATDQAKELGFNASYFSYNNKEGACPTCGGSGVVTLDIQYLPDMQQTCPTCEGKRYRQEIMQVKWHGYSIVDLLELDVNEAIPVFAEEDKILKDLKLLKEVGLSYLHLGEDTVSLSGGEAQRLKLVKYLHHRQKTTLFIFDEPSIGLHPLDVKVLLEVMEQLIKQGATIIIISHDPNLIVNSDYLLDLGPKGGSQGGQVVADGKTTEVIADPTSLTTKYLHEYVGRFE